MLWFHDNEMVWSKNLLSLVTDCLNLDTPRPLRLAARTLFLQKVSKNLLTHMDFLNRLDETLYFLSFATVDKWHYV